MSAIHIMRRTASEWWALKQRPDRFVLCIDSDTGRVKIGDGVRLWKSLPYLGGDGVASINGRNGVVTIAAADLGLGSVDNTRDADKPVSRAQAAADAAVLKAARSYADSAIATAMADLPQGLTQVKAKAK